MEEFINSNRISIPSIISLLPLACFAFFSRIFLFCAECGLAPRRQRMGQEEGKLISGICDQGDWHYGKPTRYPDNTTEALALLRPCRGLSYLHDTR